MILMSMAAGFTSRVMAMSGSLIRKHRGPHIKREDGFMNHITAGLGYRMSRGVGPLTITGGGFIIAIHGVGGLDRFMSTTVRSGRRHLSSLSASDTVPASALAPSDGSPWVRMIPFIPGTDAASIA